MCFKQFLKHFWSHQKAVSFSLASVAHLIGTSSHIPVSGRFDSWSRHIQEATDQFSLSFSLSRPYSLPSLKISIKSLKKAGKGSFKLLFKREHIYRKLFGIAFGIAFLWIHRNGMIISMWVLWRTAPKRCFPNSQHERSLFCWLVLQLPVICMKVKGSSKINNCFVIFIFWFFEGTLWVAYPPN